MHLEAAAEWLLLQGVLKTYSEIRNLLSNCVRWVFAVGFWGGSIGIPLGLVSDLLLTVHVGDAWERYCRGISLRNPWECRARFERWVREQPGTV